MADIDLKELDQRWNVAFEQLKKALKEQEDKLAKGVGGTAEIEAKIAKIQADLDKHEKTWADHQRREAVDRQISEMGSPEVEGRTKEVAQKERRAFLQMLRFNNCEEELRPHVKWAAAPPEKKALSVSSDSAGGYLAPPEFVVELLKGIVEYSPIRAYARKFNTSRHSIQIPKKTGAITASWAGEITTRAESTGMAFGLETIFVHEQTAKLITSNWMLEDAVFDVEGLIRQECIEQFGKGEGTAFVNGTGVAQPAGITNTDSGCTQCVCADTSGHLLKDTDLIAAQYKLPEAYQSNARFAFLWAQIGKLRALKDATSGQYLWSPLREGTPPMVLGKPYFACPDLLVDGTAAARHVGLYGDFQKAYTIVDRIEVAMLRDPYTAASTNQICFWARRRVGGQVVMGEAMVEIVTG